MRDRSDVTLSGARNSGRWNLDFQSVTGRQIQRDHSCPQADSQRYSANPLYGL
jgi:hypothetical protein